MNLHYILYDPKYICFCCKVSEEWALQFLMYSSKCTYKWIIILKVLRIITKLARSLFFLDKFILLSPAAKGALCNHQKGIYPLDLKLELSSFDSADLNSHVCREPNQQLVVTYCTICAGSLRHKQELKDGGSSLTVIFIKINFLQAFKKKNGRKHFRIMQLLWEMTI